MARELTFSIGKKEFGVSPRKVDRRKLYGWTEVVALDDKGDPCHLVSTDDSGTLIIPGGGTGMGIVDEEGLWVDRSELVTVNRDGSPAELYPSSFSSVIPLKNKVTTDEYLDHSITDFYQLEVAGGEFVKALGNNIFNFLYCYVEGCEGYPAFVMTVENDSGRVPFMLIGERNDFEMLGFEEPGVIEDTGDDIDRQEDDDQLDFSML